MAQGLWVKKHKEDKKQYQAEAKDLYQMYHRAVLWNEKYGAATVMHLLLQGVLCYFW